MVFTKLTASQKEELAIFKAEYGTVLTSSMRALVMRGSSSDDAKKMVLSRQTARAELVEEMEKEAEAQNELQEPIPPVKAPRKPRGPNKSKPVVEPKPVVEDIKLTPIPEDVEQDYKHMKITLPKPKAKAKAKAVETVDDLSNINILL